MTTFDNVAEFSSAGRSAINEGSRRLGEIYPRQMRASAVMAVPLEAQSQFLVGVGAQWSFRAEADPGVYGAGSFGAPVAVRAIDAA